MQARLGLLVLPSRAAAIAGGSPGGEWLGAAHVPLLCSHVAPPPCSRGSVPAGGSGKVVQTVAVEGRWGAGALALLPRRCGAGGAAGERRGGEGEEELLLPLLVVLRRVLGSISLARSCGSSEAAAPGPDCAPPAHIWREIPDESGGRLSSGPSRDCDNGDAGPGGGGGLIPLPGGLWVRVEVRAGSASASSSHGGEARAFDTGPCLRVTVAQEEGACAGDGEGQMVCSLLHEVQRVADGVAASLVSCDSAGLQWVLAAA
jgi:hypothetical protein